MSLFSQLSRRSSRRPRCRAVSRRSTKRSQLAVPAQVLEDRTLLTGLVMDQSVFDVTQFAANIEEQIPVDTNGLNGVVGYSYAIINGDPDNPITDAGNDPDGESFKGYSRMPWDGALGAFPILTSPNAPQEIASPSKVLTAAAVMHLLQQQNPGELEVELDKPIVTYLPENWGPGNPSDVVNGWTPFFNTITVRELLTHTSGLLPANNNTGGTVTGPAGVNAYDYGSLQQIAENGVVNVVFNSSDGTTSWPADYWTNNFAWFRVMLPYMWDEINAPALDANAANGILLDTEALTSNESLRDDLVDAMLADWDDTGLLFGTDIMVITPDEVVASIYKYYVSEYILKPSGVDDPQSKTTGSFPTLLYPLAPTIVPGSEIWQLGPDGSSAPTPAIVAGFDTDDRTRELGSRGWNLSVSDLARAWSGIRHGAIDGSTILEQETLDLMDDLALGWQHSTLPNGYTGDFGQYYGHNGVNFRPRAIDSQPTDGSTPGTAITLGWPDPTVANPRLANMNNSVAIAFPNDVEAAILINSQIRTADQPNNSPSVIGAAFNPGGAGTGTNAALINAYDNAWTELVYDGFSSGDDTFLVRTNASDSAYIDIVHQIPGITGPLTIAVITRRADTLHKLTLNGEGGNDTFNIQQLPAGLEIVINGGSGGDEVIVGGQAGSFDLGDNTPGTLTFHGGAGFDELTIDDTDDNDLNQTYTIWNDRVTRTGAGTYWYDGVSELTLNANGQANFIDVQSTTSSTITTINGQGGNDTITLGGAEIDDILGLIDVVGGDHDDTVRFWDVVSFTANDYEFRSNALLLGTSAVIGYGEDDDIELWAGNEDDAVTVESLAAGQTLDLILGHGDDDVTVNLLSNPLTTSVLGGLAVHGGSGTEDTLTINDATHLESSDYVVTNTSVDREDIQPIDYDSVEELNLFGGVSASNYDIESTSVPTTVTGGILADTFNVGKNVFGDPDLNDIDGSLTIEGGDNFAGEDTVYLNDSLGSNGAYVIQNELVTGNNFAGITLVDIHHGILNTSNLGVIVHVENAEGDTRYTVNGGFGNNTYHLAFGSKNLSTFDHPLIINGGVNDDDLFLYDASTPGPRNYTVTENSVDRLLFGERSFFNTDIGVTFSSMTSVELHMNDQNSTVNVQSTNPNSKYIFHGNDGTDTLNLNRHVDEDVDPFIDIDGIAVTSAGMDIEHHDFEQLNLKLGDELNTVRVHNLESSAAINLGLGDDRVFVTPDSGSLSAIHFPMVVNGQGGTDRVHLLDQNFGGNDPFTVTKNSVDRFLFGPLIAPGLTYVDVDFVRLFMGAGDNVVNIDSTAPGTEYLFDGGLGDDTFFVNLLPTSPLTLFGSVGDDHAVITGTEGDDEVSISAGFGTADINMPNTETATFDGLGGTDVLVAEGVVGTDEQMEIEASTTAGAGDLRIITTTPRGDLLFDLVFENTEIFDLVGNPKDMDTATFIGTDQDDRFEIDLSADGTNADPVLQLFEPDGVVPLLTLRDYRNFGTLQVRGEDGADEFNVYALPAGPGTGRNLAIDGGSPSGPGNPKDELNVYREIQPPPPPGPNPGNNSEGTIDVLYELFEFHIDFLDIEKVKVLSNNAAG